MTTTPSLQNPAMPTPESIPSSTTASTLAEPQSTFASNESQADGYVATQSQEVNPLSTWTAQIAASLSTLSDQIASASTAIGQHPHSQGDPFADVGAGNLHGRLAAIEEAQARLEADFGEIRTQIESQVRENGETEAANAAVNELSTQVKELAATIKLDQLRLYPRLLNATVTVSKMPIKALPTAGGKPPLNFPATRGEFEHLTKERYEDILKAYELPIKGDTAVKREALRSFIGLPS
ncbi:hypothetical protein HGRIS_000733 [Hohenbuehelia grisea]|uniref:Uncharacterized protein n=1 Tax=Hohenbuehelia grisea TaxID=104357 RepID=A0ABR3IPL6_9AGAR